MGRCLDRAYNWDMNLYGFTVDLWTLWGLAAQGVFFFSFVFQWAASEKERKSVIPMGFWVLRIIASLMLIVYVLERRDIVFLISLVLQIAIYLRNISLIKNENKG